MGEASATLQAQVDALQIGGGGGADAALIEAHLHLDNSVIAAGATDVVAAGENSRANGSNTVTLGREAVTGNSNAVAVGFRANAGSVADTALGNSARATGGGSTALGHPFGATGARILSQAVKELASRPSGTRAIVSICADGGLGTMALLEAA